MSRGFRHTPDGLHQFFPPQPASLGHSLSLHQFGQQRPASHGRHASFGAKPNLRNAPSFDSQSQFQNVPARWIFDLNRRVWIVDFARIARMLEMIENLGRVHATRL